VSRTHASILGVVLSGILFGTAGTAQAVAPLDTTPFAVGALRLLVGAAVLLGAMVLTGLDPRRLLRLWRTWPGVVAGASSGIFQVCFFASVSEVGVALGTLMTVGSAPIFAGLLGRVVLGNRLTRTWVVATFVCLMGLTLRSSGELGEGSAVGLLLAIAAGLCSALYNVAAKHQLEAGVSRLEVPTAAFVLGGLMLVPLLIGQPLHWVAEPSGVILVLYLGVATMALANFVLMRGIEGLAPGPVTTLMLTDPLVATLLGVLVLEESLSTVAAIGLLLVLGGLLLQGGVLARRTPTPQPEPVPVL
jgi:drug/metabolite transporter, DME family